MSVSWDDIEWKSGDSIVVARPTSSAFIARSAVTGIFIFILIF